MIDRMTGNDSKIAEGEREALSAIANDALTIFRAGLFLIVIYITILSLTLRTGGVDYVENIINSFYTINGIVFWMGSVTLSVVTHRIARRVTLQENYTNIGLIDDKYDTLNIASACTFGLLISVFSLIFGLLEGWANTVNQSSGTIGFEQPILIVGFSVIMVSIIYSIFSVMDIIRDKFGPIRELFRI